MSMGSGSRAGKSPVHSSGLGKGPGSSLCSPTQSSGLNSNHGSPDQSSRRGQRSGAFLLGNLGRASGLLNSRASTEAGGPPFILLAPPFCFLWVGPGGHADSLYSPSCKPSLGSPGLDSGSFTGREKKSAFRCSLLGWCQTEKAYCCSVRYQCEAGIGVFHVL